MIEPYIIVRCPSHTQLECWIVRRYNEVTNTYVYDYSSEDLQEVNDYVNKRGLPQNATR